MNNVVSAARPKINEILRKLMSEMRITEAELARRTGTPQPTLHRILSGSTRSPRGESLSRLANFFSITISQLIGDDPLPNERIPGTHNPNVRSWASVPMISLEDVLAWPSIKETMQETNWSSWTTTDVDITADTYAISVRNETLNPRFPQGTVLIVDPTVRAEDRDYVVVQTQGQRIATVKQLLLDGQDMYLKPLNPEFQTTMLGGEHTILGVVLQARTDTRRNTQRVAMKEAVE